MANVKNRMLNRDGTDNINRSQLRRSWNDSYHHMLSISWPRFFVFTVLSYLSVNILFGLLFFVLGSQGLEGTSAKSGWPFLEESFFFSVQTFSTIGYGRVSPVGFAQNVIVSVEAFFGMLSVAVMSGLLFARFSRPTARVTFSEKALISQHMGRPAFIFRMANARLNQMAEARVAVSILLFKPGPNGERFRQQFDLNLIRSTHLFFALSWVVVHLIDEASPLYGMNAADLEEAEAEIFVSLMGYDSTFSQTITTRYSYIWSEIHFDRHFVDIISRVDGKLNVDISKISEFKALTTT